MEQSETTHFGYQKVAAAEKARKVADVFDSVADKYDLMNDLMSLGVHRLWKRFAVRLSGVRAGERVLDLAGGTGDLTARLLPLLGSTGFIVLSDINATMLVEGRRRLVDAGAVSNIAYVQADAETLPFPDQSFDCITIGFGLRNVTYKDRALAAMYAALKPGGRVVILEFSQPVAPGLKPAYDLYSFSLLPILGKLVANDADSYRYLAESIRMHPDQETLRGMMETAGFERCQYFNLTGGIVAVHRGYKF
ncbi:bifunctional: 2-octaprenyl-6-methoxy-1,4-benzoquinone methylase; S-adenosylmethionine:2-DMK methyltransferase [Candidatus Competibacter denitrificans Run_A_D11]|uniref:Ubiquinone/menaquinone biosynthesis C-methyltransferase UbiE n=1 Tax=Candidatus Competibacter denitrificans Run_A_D11 TaxID=1400863 RepID=W6M3C1_9GAMM|nr:bifunctional demethylmenaquinone methyltransferase/2-methoxy-6-polyprenyl-1,4-benzoquinol methylase UbiE [Candidatus Competibacter denitrificans]CDI02082.1 bifunctional: 2-octaprenyl-6-methoxy-1,4-benzoquinone methylase; S-adenosylmethionine:2-DMK methyltransferase [Candidatus Competibacter denitrificans Run_A_D11]HAS87152.1 bifunctional demethylmenaquinone methyltransferase/2-methoxy-6-polyprenyl-1,4-benzoquinol methylase UbiE [Candidatus Competibacteraceae bacterium]HRC70700.1 bifunctional 